MAELEPPNGMESRQGPIRKLLQEGGNPRYFLGYLICGGVATFVDFSLFLILNQYFGVWYLYSNSVSYPIGMLTNFWLNKFYNFKNSYRGFVKQFISFCLVGGIGFLAHQIILDRKSTRLNSSHSQQSRMPSSA